MKKLKAFLLALVLFVLTVSGGGYYYIRKLKLHYQVNNNEVRNSLNFYKFSSKDIIASNITKDTTLILGSSELNSAYDYSEHASNMLNYSDLNVCVVGSGNYQSIIHTSIIGSLGESIKNIPVFLIISPQWFEKNGIESAAFVSRISKEHVLNLMENPKISEKNKRKFIDRILKLSENSSLHKDFQEYKDIYIEKKLSASSYISVMLKNKKEIFNNKFKFKNTFAKRYEDDDKPYGNDFNLKELLLKADEKGKKACTNNEFKIENGYYVEYVEPKYKELKDTQKDMSYDESLEYEDLELFLNISKELGLDLHFISVPVHGIWYDYVGFPKEKRQSYYKKIREIASSHKTALLDLSNHEYTDYFLKDIMHLGWKGWLYIDEEIIKVKNSKK